MQTCILSPLKYRPRFARLSIRITDAAPDAVRATLASFTLIVGGGGKRRTREELETETQRARFCTQPLKLLLIFLRFTN